jgi:uncharacterized protein (DUF1501 family)
MNDRCCEGIRPAKFSRRFFMKQGGIALAGLSTMPAFLQRAIASTPAAGKKQLVVLFQRGAADGLNIVPPFGEPNLLSLATIAIPHQKRAATRPCIDLDGFFGPRRSLLCSAISKNSSDRSTLPASDPTRSH